METKVCSHCKRELPISEFYRNKDGRYQAWCKDCKRKEQMENGNASYARRSKSKNGSATTKPILLDTYNINEVKKILVARALRDFEGTSKTEICSILGIARNTLSGFDTESVDASKVESTYVREEEKKLTDYTPRELMKALYDLGYDGTFYTYVRQENTLSHLFGDEKH